MQQIPKGCSGTQGGNKLSAKKELSPSRHNISQEETKAIKELKSDSSRVILTVDKGVAMVVMDKQDYLNKAQKLLLNTDTYKPIHKDPTSRLKNKLAPTLKEHYNDWFQPQKTIPYMCSPSQVLLAPQNS